MASINPRMVLIPGPREIIASYCARLATLHGRHADEFCRDIGLNWNQLVSGCLRQAAALADLCQVSREDFAGRSIHKEGLFYRIRDQTVARSDLLSTVRVCPRCIAKDVQVRTGPEAIRPFIRSEWMLRPIHVCVDHQCVLVPIEGKDGSVGNDLAKTMINASANALKAVDDAGVDCSPTSLETYLFDRLLGAVRDDSDPLRGMPLHVVIDASEKVGALALQGPSPVPYEFSDFDWRDAGAAGFDILTSRPSAIRRLVNRLVTQFMKTSRQWHAADILGGAFYTWILNANHPDYDRLRTAIRIALHREAPFGHGDQVLGVRLSSRKVHSLCSASHYTGLPSLILRAILIEHGVLNESCPHFREVACCSARPRLTSSC